MKLTDQKIQSKQELEIQLKFYKNIADFSNSWEVFRDKTGNLVYCNSAIEKLTGYTKPEYETGVISMKELIHPDDYELNLRKFSQAMNKETISDFEIRIITKNKEIKYCSISSQPVIDENNQYLGFRSTIKDITERKIFEAELLKKEKQYQLILQTTFEGFWVVDIEGNFLKVNDNYCKMIGYSREELLAMKISDVEEIEDEAAIAKRRKIILETGYMRFESKHRCKNSNIIDLAISIHLNPDEKNILVFLEDITKRKQTEEALIDSKKKHKNLVNSIGEGIVIIDLNDNFTFVNPAAENIFGVPKNTLLNKNLKDFISETELLEVRHRGKKAFKNKAITYEIEIIRPDNEKRQIIVTSTASFDEENNLIGSFNVFRDITEKRSVEKEVQSLLNHQKIILDNSTIGITFLKDRRCIWANKYAKNLFGYLEEELFDIESEFLHSSHENYINFGDIAYSLINKGKIFQSEYLMKKKDGSLFWCLLTGSAVNPKNYDEGSIWIIEDIDDRKKYEEQIKIFSSAVEQSSQSIIITDTEGIIEYVNPFFENQTGYSLDEAKGMTPRVLKSGETPNEVYEELWKKIKSGESWSGEFHNKKKNGELYWENTIISPIKDRNNKIIKFMGIKEDITLKKKSQEELQKSSERLRELNAMKDKFFSIIAHDLKNPLGSVLSYSEILVNNFEQKSPENIKEGINLFHQASKQTYNLLENLLDWARSQTGSINFLPRNLNLKELIWDKFELFISIANQKNITLYFEDPKDIFIFADKNMIDTVLRNLISNALKFTGSGGEIKISAKEYQEHIEISVSDTGIGIKNKDIDKFFRIDKRVERLGTAGEKGTGLGLILCKEFVEKNNGKIWVKKNEGVGATFSFTIPIPKI